MAKFIDITNQTFGVWKAIKYLGNSRWKCVNNVTKEEKDIHSYSLKTRYSGIVNKGKMPDGILNNKFGNWEVIEYIGGGFWRCICECGHESNINGSNLKNGVSTMCSKCSHTKRLKNSVGEKIGYWEIIEYTGNGYWKCKCLCGTIKEVYGRHIRNGESKSCGCKVDKHRVIKDITGKTFNSLTVLKYTGKDSMWECKCSCGNIKNIHRYSIITEKTKSCGCQKEIRRVETLFNTYGDTNTTRINNPRQEWQIKATSSKEDIVRFIGTIEEELNVLKISKLLDITTTSTAKMLKKYGLDTLVKTKSGESALEIDIRNYIKSLTDCKVIVHDRTITKDGTEIDIYLPEFKIAIEVNGTYWHSNLYKDELYHQNKTISAAKQGIHLIHIFEHEWKNDRTKEKIQYYLRELIVKDSSLISDRDIEIRLVNSIECEELISNYHLQPITKSSINLGYYNNSNELLGVMAFNKETDREYSLERICWKRGYKVLNGEYKILRQFIERYNPESIVAYCNITKFNGSIYSELGFKATNESILKPDYVWVNRENLVLNTITEDDSIIEALGFFKIYDSGRLEFKWYK